MLSDEEMILSFLYMKTVLMTPEAFPFGSDFVRKRFRSEAFPFGSVSVRKRFRLESFLF